MTGILSGLLGLLVGALIGHRLALGRDKRKEFNKVAAPIYERLIQAEEQAQNLNVWVTWDDAEILRLKPHLTNSERKKLDSLFENYREAIRLSHTTEDKKPWEGTEPIKEEFYRVVSALKDLKKMLRLR